MTKIFALHQALWQTDRWYRWGWFAWPQGVALLAGLLIATSGQAPLPLPSEAPWVKPVTPPPGPAIPTAELQLCANVMADAKLRGEACDRLIKGGRLSGLDLAVAYFGRAWMQQLANQWDAAIADYSEAIKLNPNHYIAHNGRGWMYIQRGELDKALADFDRSIEINRPNNALAFANRAEVRRRQNRLDEASADIAEALRLNDKLEFSRIVERSIQTDRDRARTPPAPPPAPPPTAPTTATAPTAVPPTTAQDLRRTHRARAQASMEKKDWDGAIAELTKLIDGGGAEWLDYDARGGNHLNKQQLDLALADFTRAAGMAGHDWRPHANKALTLSMRGDVDGALAEAGRAIGDHQSRDPRVFQFRASLYERKQAWWEALKDYNTLVELTPNHFEGYFLRGRFERHMTLAQMEKCRSTDQRRPANQDPICLAPISFNPALNDLQKALSFKSDLAGAHYEIALIKADQNAPQEAIEAYTKAIRANANFSEAYNNRGVLYQRLKQKELALADYNEAIRANPRNKQALSNRAGVFADSGQRQQAIADYRKALDLDGQFGPALEGLKRFGVNP